LIGVAPQTAVSANTRETYWYDGQGRVVGEHVESYDGSAWSDTAQIQYVYAGNHLIQLLDSANGSVVSFVWGPDGKLAGVAYNSATSSEIDAAVVDGSDNLKELVNAATKAVVGEYKTDPFGNPLGGSTPVQWMPGFFGGMIYDQYSGLYIVGEGIRFGNPQWGGWMQPDSTDYSGGYFNQGPYCNNDPVNLIDPEGTAAEAASAYQGVSQNLNDVRTMAGSFGAGTFGLYRPANQVGMALLGRHERTSNSTLSTAVGSPPLESPMIR